MGEQVIMQDKIGQNTWVKISILLLCGTIFYDLSTHLVWNITDSVNHRLGYLADGTPRKGDYVRFEFNHPLILGNSKVILTKRIVCESGDIVRTEGVNVFCNERMVAKGLERTASGEPLTVYQFAGEIPTGKVLLLGDSDDSFDGRYWGLIDRNNLTRVVPII